MLRQLFGEPQRVDQGLIKQANQSLSLYIQKQHAAKAQEQNWEIWGQSFITALDELEQGLYCCEKYSEMIKQPYVEKMQAAEQANYHRYLYFYKNSFIRVFSILDKLGYYLNKRLQLKTEKVKLRFSYFTVLRQMHEHHVHTELEQKLYDLKLKYSEPLYKLRDQRNVEIHSINYEAIDDLSSVEKQALAFSSNHIENLALNKQYLQQCFELVCLTIDTIFTYENKSKP